MLWKMCERGSLRVGTSRVEGRDAPNAGDL